MASYRPSLRDYKPPQAKSQPRAHWLIWFVAGLGLPLIIVAVLAPKSASPPPLLPTQSTEPTLSATGKLSAESRLKLVPSTEVPALIAAPAEPVDGQKLSLVVGRGDSLDRLFRRNGFSPAELALILREEAARQHLRVIRPGDEIVIFHRDQKILGLQREIDFARSLKVERSEEGYKAEVIEHKLVARQAEARGRIKSSLYAAGAEAGLSDRAIMNLAGIFAWDIDFVLDIRTGDEFAVIIEELWRDGERVAEGDILAAQFVNQGEAFRAVRFQDGSDRASYYTPEGRNLRKAFLRAPLSFSRISSNFNPNRRHPVLNTIRAHRGVDYAAPTGTPIMAAGDGKVIFRGVQGGYGNTVILQHGGNITTLYAHLNGFNKQARAGNRVQQGSIIGYVGQTGLASGPHLHYEYRINGMHMNPRTVRLPDAQPIDATLRADFMRVASPLLEQLDGQSRMVAQATTALNN